MNILFLTDNFPPEVNAPASRTFEHCREWVRLGHRVTVVTCVPNFPKGEIYEGYQNRIWQTEEMEGIRVIRLWSYITANEGLIKRSLDYLSFMISAVLASPFMDTPDVVLGTSPQFFSVCAAYVVSRMKGIPFVFELRDIWPESIKAVGAMEDSLPLRSLEKVELFLYRKAKGIISVTESFKKNLVHRGIDPAKIEVVLNGIDFNRFRPIPKDPELVTRYELDGKFVVGYVGTHGMAHALETILTAAERIRSMNGGDAFRFIFLGDGARKKELVQSAQKRGLINVLFLDSVAKDDVVRYWSLLDASIIHLKRTDLFTKVIPSKLFESIGMGIPVLHGVAGESAAIVEKEGVGLLFEPENVDELCEKLLILKNEPALYRKCRIRCNEAAKNYDRSVLARRMTDILERWVHLSR
jgi:glycosyltransferase involved in cell wall biosynthesis